MRILLLSLLFTALGMSGATNPPPILLPAPITTGGTGLMAALAARQSQRDFNPAPLSPAILSQLLWAAAGTNRPATGGRTVPSAMNSQEIEVYLVTVDGVYRYAGLAHRLEPVLAGDHRSLTGGQPFARQAPVSFVYVADTARMPKAKPADFERYNAMDAAFMVQNVYLLCAAEGLATVVHELDRPPLAKLLELRPEQKIILAQAIGWPKPAP